jgi:NitT/TauT family transport system permease protein
VTGVDPTTQFIAEPPDPTAADTTAGGVRRLPRESWARTVLPPLLLGLVILGIWYLISFVVLDPRRRFLLEPPHEVLQVGFFTWDNLSTILEGLYWSTRVALTGLAISIVLGVTIAVIMSQTVIFERALFPYLVFLQAIPILAIVPLISFWFGTGENSRVLVCVLISIFPIIVNTLFGLQSADPLHHDLFTLQQANRWTRLRKLMFPGALPAMFAGLRISAGLSVIGAIVGEFFFGRGETGLGQLLKRYANRLEGEQLIATVIISSALGVVVFLFFGWLQRRVIGKWYQSTTQ